MIIALSSSGQGQDSLLDPRLGRCSTFAFYNDAQDAWNFSANPGNLQGSGAGIKAAQFLIEQKTEVLLTGEMGPKAARVLNSAGITVCSLPEIPLEEALKQYKERKGKVISDATVSAHTGLNSRRNNDS